MSDLIRREDAIKAYNEAMDELVKWQMEEWQLGDFSECEFNTTDCKHIVRKLEAIPSADRPQGEWSIDSIDEIELSYGGTAYEPVYKCSHCGRTTESYVRFDKPLMPEDANFPNFCGWCGARMKGEDDE